MLEEAKGDESANPSIDSQPTISIASGVSVLSQFKISEKRDGWRPVGDDRRAFPTIA